jgi:hypothetical protein
VLTGPDAEHLTTRARHDWTGLETGIRIGQSPAAVVVRALDASGRAVGVSETITP